MIQTERECCCLSESQQLPVSSLSAKSEHFVPIFAVFLICGKMVHNFISKQTSFSMMFIMDEDEGDDDIDEGENVGDDGDGNDG